ncbi:hypothetical protein B0H16DRAFT_1481592 [Mycena metata]|uniref:Uncharacterized protein n=1 Tax=Mycena metata TaxID=1033252 RepID=A0AAD7M9T5_9AGAR|nr:hypothetical protein B0H16DRAFT_1481592 [Mycena metata]
MDTKLDTRTGRTTKAHRKTNAAVGHEAPCAHPSNEPGVRGMEDHAEDAKNTLPPAAGRRNKWELLTCSGIGPTIVIEQNLSRVFRYQAEIAALVLLRRSSSVYTRAYQRGAWCTTTQVVAYCDRRHWNAATGMNGVFQKDNKKQAYRGNDACGASFHVGKKKSGAAARWHREEVKEGNVVVEIGKKDARGVACIDEHVMDASNDTPWTVPDWRSSARRGKARNATTILKSIISLNSAREDTVGREDTAGVGSAVAGTDVSSGRRLAGGAQMSAGGVRIGGCRSREEAHVVERNCGGRDEGDQGLGTGARWKSGSGWDRQPLGRIAVVEWVLTSAPDGGVREGQAGGGPCGRGCEMGAGGGEAAEGEGTGSLSVVVVVRKKTATWLSRAGRTAVQVPATAGSRLEK